jgi:hypothetical protein
MPNNDRCPLCEHEIVNMLLDTRATSVVQSVHAFVIAFLVVQDTSHLPLFTVVESIVDEIHRSHSA